MCKCLVEPPGTGTFVCLVTAMIVGQRGNTRIQTQTLHPHKFHRFVSLPLFSTPAHLEGLLSLWPQLFPKIPIHTPGSSATLSPVSIQPLAHSSSCSVFPCTHFFHTLTAPSLASSKTAVLQQTQLCTHCAVSRNVSSGCPTTKAQHCC